MALCIEHGGGGAVCSPPPPQSMSRLYHMNGDLGKAVSNAPLVETGRDRRRRSLRDYRRTNSDQAADNAWNVQECPRMSGAIFAVKGLKTLAE
jgi:hypothetical protein